MKSIYSGLVFAFLSFYIGHSQISGRVTNSETNEPIEEVQIQIPNRDYIVYSNADGAFELSNIVAGPKPVPRRAEASPPRTKRGGRGETRVEVTGAGKDFPACGESETSRSKQGDKADRGAGRWR